MVLELLGVRSVRDCDASRSAIGIFDFDCLHDCIVDCRTRVQSKSL